VYADDRVTVYENHLAYPRAFFADAARAEPDPAQVLRAVTSDGFDGRRLALLETDRVPAVAAATGRDLVSMTDWRPTRLSLATSTDGPRVLVLSEMYFPGWQALVDGTETPIYRANYLFRAVYRPRAVVWGAAASALAGAVALMLACVRRRASPPSPRPLSPTAA
jgi:hypothetical protein